jgi:hypothetical protein
MNAWTIILMTVVVAAVYVVIKAGLTARRHFRTHKLVRCPVLGVGSAVLISRAGLAELFGWPALRRVSDCTYWPRRAACGQRCRLAPTGEFRDYQKPLV